MPRLFYDTALKVYHLFKKHPAMSVLLSEFSIDDDNLKDICDFLITNDKEIQEENMSFEYNEGNLIDQIANLYGFTGGPPWNTFTSPNHIKLTELLNMTIYLYKFGNTDNFYAKRIFDFIPENDREYIQSQPKLKLTVEALGRKLDDLEDRISRMHDVIDIDDTPDALLDYLGQNLGYEREDFTLSDVSFRELLKNIIEIYKIKGTNYSFSFFFKFLGFEVNLKEFFFNREVSNPESFPGVDKERVENFLTTTNPVRETGDPSQGIYLTPTKFLDQTRNLNEWDVEYNSLVAHGCLNPSEYMRGLESFNNDGVTWHQSPWTYFKTNLIEYELNPFVNNLSLTANDNETIRKYVRFLSPTYLFTWINVNLNPWIEDLTLITSDLDSDDDWLIEIEKIMGDPRPSAEYTPWPAHQPGAMGVPSHNPGDPWVQTVNTSPGFNGLHNDGNYLDYEDMENYIEIYDWVNPNDPIDYNKEHIVFDIQNLMNIGGLDQIGTYLRHNGIHIRQPGHPKYITDAYHKATPRMAFDNVGIWIKLSTETDMEENWRDYSSKAWPTVPVYIDPPDGSLVKNTNVINFEWEEIEGQIGYWIQMSNDRNFNNIVINESTLSQTTNYYTSPILHNDRYYWRVRTKNELGDFGAWAPTYRFTLQNLPFPYDGELIESETFYVRHSFNSATSQFESKFKIMWPKELITERYKIQVSKDVTFINFIVIDQEETTTNDYEVSLPNGVYYWRYQAKNINTGWTSWRPTYTFTLDF